MGAAGPQRGRSHNLIRSAGACPPELHANPAFRLGVQSSFTLLYVIPECLAFKGIHRAAVCAVENTSAVESLPDSLPAPDWSFTLPGDYAG